MSDAQIRLIEAQLKRITDALLGDEDMGHIGMVAELRSVKETVDQIQQERRDEKAQKRGAVWVLTSVASMGGVIGGIIAWVADFWQKKP